MELVLHGDAATAPASWNTRGDRAMWSNPKAVEKVRKGLARIPVKGTVNMIFDDRATFAIVGTMADGPALMTPLMKDGLNMFVRNNEGSRNRHNPLTPWILIHRMHHSYELCGKRIASDAGADVSINTGAVILEAEKELRAVFGIDNKSFGDNMFCYLFTRACTMKSARINQLFPFHVDIAAELFAQKLVTGEIKFEAARFWKFERVQTKQYHNHAGGHRDAQEGAYRHFYTTLHESFDFNEKVIAQCDEIIARYKPLINAALEHELNLMQTIPNII